MSIGLTLPSSGPPQGLLLFPGINAILDWSFTLTHGTGPNIANVTIAPQATIPQFDGTMTIVYGGQIVAAFLNCRIDASSIERNTQNMIVRLNIKDRRWKWAFPTISGNYNQWKDNTDLGSGMSGNTSAELVAGTEAAPIWLMSQCLLALGEDLDDYDLTKVPNDSRPEVDWDYTPASEALAQLADYTGCRVIMRADEKNSISVQPEGTGGDLPQTLDIQYIDPSVDPPEIPSGIACVCSRIRYNLDFGLEAIGIDNDGTIKALADLSYAPDPGEDDGGWSQVDLETMNQISDLTVRARALACVYKWYRISTVKGYGTMPKAEFASKEFNRLDFLPLEETQIFSITEVAEEGTITREKPAQVYGLFYAAAAGQNIRHDNTQTTLKPIAIEPGMVDPTDPYTKAVLYNGGFSLDVRRGIVKFSEPLYMWAKRDDDMGDEREPAQLILRTSCNYRDPATGACKRYQRMRPLAYGNQNTQPQVLMHDELVLKRYPSYAPGSTEAFAVTGLSDNRAEIDPYADYYINQQAQTYQVDYTQTVGYSTLRNILLDGAIREITWQGSLGGATTRVARNNETHPHVMSYREKRFLDAARAAGREAAKTRTERFRDLNARMHNDALLGTPSMIASTSQPFIPPGDSIG
jgi:hypothetical protein